MQLRASWQPSPSSVVSIFDIVGGTSLFIQYVHVLPSLKRLAMITEQLFINKAFALAFSLSVPMMTTHRKASKALVRKVAVKVSRKQEEDRSRVPKMTGTKMLHTSAEKLLRVSRKRSTSPLTYLAWAGDVKQGREYLTGNQGLI